MNPFSGIFIDEGLSHTQTIERYRQRRLEVAQKLGHITVIGGTQTPPGGKNSWVHLPTFIYQEPLMLFLTGINQLKTALILDPQGPIKEILFITPKNTVMEFWEGKRFGVGDEDSLEEVRFMTGIHEVQDLANLDAYLAQRLSQTQETLGLYWHQGEKKALKEDNWAFKTQLASKLKRSKIKNPIINIEPQMWDLRFPLDEYDFKNSQIAQDKTREAFLETLKKIKTCQSETEVAGFLNGQIQQRSYFGNSFPSIIASGLNATVLHYTKNNDPLVKDGLLLMDFGVRWQSMHADVSRTVPVSGKFNPLQSLLYTIVLEAQALFESMVQPGAILDDLNSQCWDYINAQLKQRFIDQGGTMKLAYAKAPHNISHLIGMQVHDGDPFRSYKKQPLKAGMMISNEPGIYGHFAIDINGIHYNESIGIRIEDDLWVTASGCLNLSHQCPKSIADIEKLMAD